MLFYFPDCTILHDKTKFVGSIIVIIPLGYPIAHNSFKNIVDKRVDYYNTFILY